MQRYQIVALLWFCTVEAALCPYAAYNSTFTLDCHQANTSFCIVDSNCTIIQNLTTKDQRVAESPFTLSYRAINWTEFDGTASGLPCVYVVRVGKADFLAQIPNTNSYLRFQDQVQIVGNLSEATRAKGLDFEGNNQINLSVAVFPPSMTFISIANCLLTSMPKTIPYGQLTNFYGSSNNFQSLENIDFLNSSEINFANCSLLTTLSNVSLSSKLEKFIFNGASFTTFRIDASTYEALMNVSIFSVKSIDVSSSCAAPHEKRPLHNYTVCVATDTVEVTTSAFTGLIAGVSVSVAGIIALTAVIVFLIQRRKKANNGGDWSMDSEIVATFEELGLLRLDDKALKKLTSVARGAFGEVWKGEYKGDIIAIKCLLPGKSSRNEILLLIDEIKLTNKLDCPYIVKTIGAAWRVPSELQMILEWMDRGDLKNVLESTKPLISGGDAPNFPWSEKIKTLLAIAEGLVYLHAFDIIHRDLKSRNILMDLNKGTKLTDFGVSREVTSETMTFGVGTYRWMAPEILQHNHYSTAADMYSFGMVISELNMHHIPYLDKRNDHGKELVDTAIISLVIQGSIKPTFTASCPTWIHKLAEECIAMKAEDRPTATKVAYIIRQHLK